MGQYGGFWEWGGGRRGGEESFIEVRADAEGGKGKEEGGDKGISLTKTKSLASSDPMFKEWKDEPIAAASLAQVSGITLGIYLINYKVNLIN